MGLTGKARSTAGSVRAFPTFGRRMFFAEQRLEQIQQELDVLVRDRDTISESLRRLAALEQQVESLHAAVTGADPQMTLEIVSSVRDEVARLSIEMTEQLNRTSDVLAGLSSPTSTPA
ncbi:hypothetical protein BH10ACT3_BH10ACT3_23910 [soil metagenome]